MSVNQHCLNRIAGERISIVEDTQVLRDRIYAKGVADHEFSIIDTGGIDIGDEPFMEQIKQQARSLSMKRMSFYLLRAEKEASLMPTKLLLKSCIVVKNRLS